MPKGFYSSLWVKAAFGFVDYKPAIIKITSYGLNLAAYLVPCVPTQTIIKIQEQTDTF